MSRSGWPTAHGERQPLLPILSQHVTDQWQRQRTLLESARAVGLGEHFTVDGTQWQRVSAKIDAERPDPTAAPIRAVNRATGKLVQLTHTENQAFWQWAIVETLRLAGLRAEELTELTHLSVRNYQRPSGEVVALLVITPSKSDRERVIPMSAELFHVIAQIIRRHISAHGTVPTCMRYDLHEKVWSEPLPYLFQGAYGRGRGVPVAGISGPTRVRVWKGERRPGVGVWCMAPVTERPPRAFACQAWSSSSLRRRGLVSETNRLSPGCARFQSSAQTLWAASPAWERSGVGFPQSTHGAGRR
ncbi:hypothetical protein ACFU6I_43580 [Streptomyces sp. NPDC057486]|uniref:hypothetical protein n=1 Tax=Streptomyces sp. NPDC057486 TaxID=3346145 RepID=UPI0036762C06